MSESWNGAGYTRRPAGVRSFVGGNGTIRCQVMPSKAGDHTNSFPPEKRRYQIYGAYGCALTQQLLILRRANRLERVVGFVPVEPALTTEGWALSGKNGEARLADVTYGKSHQNFSGRPVLPLLWDRKRELVVANNLIDIVQSLDEGLSQFSRKKVELRPAPRKKRIDELTQFINANLFQNICALAFNEVSEISARAIHTALAMFELQLAERPFLLGEEITFADLALATVLSRFQYTSIPSTSVDLSQYPVVLRFERRIHQYAEFRRTWQRQSVENHFHQSAFSTPKADPPVAGHSGNLSGWLNRFGWHFRLDR